jgi:1-deoxy-D-xylulose-5-phosphate synthase
VISVGKMLDAAEAAVDALVADGTSVSLWDARVVKPLDPAMLDDAFRHRCVLTVEDGMREGGAGSMIVDQLNDRANGHPMPKVRVLGTPIEYLAHGKPDDILAELGLDTPGIQASAIALLATDHPASV